MTTLVSKTVRPFVGFIRKDDTGPAKERGGHLHAGITTKKPDRNDDIFTWAAVMLGIAQGKIGFDFN